MEEIFGVILGTYLRVETNILNDMQGFRETWKLGASIVKLYRRTFSYKSNAVPIHSNDSDAKFILRKLKKRCHRLFQRSKEYKVDGFSKRWQPTVLLKRYIRICINKFLCWLPHIRFGQRPLRPHMFTKNTANAVYIDISTMKSFDINSIFHLLMSTVEIIDNNLKVAIQNESRADESLGRSYNVFCKIRSDERLRLGYIAYDMNAALQSISLQLIGASKDDYPMLWRYTHSKEYKKRIRSEIATDLNIEISEVKAKLTAFANGSIKGKDKHRYYKAFHEESDRLRREVLKYVSINEPDVLKRAKEQSRKPLSEEMDWTDTESKEMTKEMRSKASVFFFVWTWYERQIRQAMLTVLTDGIELHDAVYSKINVKASVLEKAIFKHTGFKVIIDVDIPGS